MKKEVSETTVKIYLKEHIRNWPFSTFKMRLSLGGAMNSPRGSVERIFLQKTFSDSKFNFIKQATVF